MKTIVVSDLHLTDIFEPRKYEFLKKLFSDCDRLVINGDLWCGFSTTFQNFINSEWNKLFPLMLEKQTVYIHGNHDHKEFIDSRVKLFASTIASSIHLNIGLNNFIVTHGHEFIKVTNKNHLNLKKILKKQKIKRIFYSIMNKLLITTHGPKVLYPFFRLLNRYVCKKAKKIFQDNSIIVSGHTHLPEFRPNRGYINTGYIMSGFAWHLEITPTSFKLQKSRY